MKNDFAAQYKHPNWQKKRLEALEYYGFQCQQCEDKETTLHVHHKRYVKGRKIWEYGVDELEVLCEPCHEFRHEVKDEIATVIAQSDVVLTDFLQVLKGFTRSCSYLGPQCEEEMAAAKTPDWYLVGMMADSVPFLSKELKIPLYEAFLAAAKKDAPRATEWHALIEQMVSKVRRQ